jgi:hypothetical protein
MLARIDDSLSNSIDCDILPPNSTFSSYIPVFARLLALNELLKYLYAVKSACVLR